MAVSNKNKKKKKNKVKNRNSKKNRKKTKSSVSKKNKKKKLNQNLKNNLNFVESKKKDSVLKKDISIQLDVNKKHNNWVSIILIVLYMFLVCIVIFLFPRFRLIGGDNITIGYNDSYVEPGYNVSILDKDVSNEVDIISNVSNGVLGEYQIEYNIDKFGIKFKKYRNVNIVDRIDPKINVNSDVINVCPNEDIPDIDYSAFDDYEGDITFKVKKTINEDEILLSVSDDSGNNTLSVIGINRGDSISPVIRLNGDSVMFLNYGSKYIEPGYSVSDNCNSDLDSRVVVSGNVGREIGTYMITYSVSDDSGNFGSVTRKVIVGKKIFDNGEVNNGSIYLTFDDGPNEYTTNKILDVLRDEDVKATFFVTCNGPDYLIKRMYDEGHMVALHTATHDYSYIYSSVDNYYSDLNRVSDRVKRITGYDSKIMRFPGGSSNTISKNYRRGIMTELSNLVLNDGYRYFDWNVDAMDASSARTSNDVYYNVTSNLLFNRSNVVLMHDTKLITGDAIRDIIRFGKENGYQFRRIEMDTYMVRHSVNN